MPAPAAAPEWRSSQPRANGHDGTTASPSDDARFLDGQEMILIIEEIGVAERARLRQLII
jgi:hypothetical protein